MASWRRAEVSNETYEVHWKNDDDHCWMVDNGYEGMGKEQAIGYAKMILKDNVGIQVKLIKCVRTEEAIPGVGTVTTTTQVVL
jgi:hypothetical protein